MTEDEFELNKFTGTIINFAWKIYKDLFSLLVIDIF